MATLQTLRKIGGFAELERAQRGHPALLLDIIETMALINSNPDDPTIKARMEQEQDLSISVLNCAPIRDICAELDASLDALSRAIGATAQALAGLNFILARSGRLCAVRAYIEPEASKKEGGCADSPIMAHMRAYYARTRDALERERRISDCAATSCGNQMESARAVEPPCARATTIAQLIALDSARAPNEYLARMIASARAAQELEEYFASLLNVIKKAKMALDLIFAQCAVLMSSRAMIAK